MPVTIRQQAVHMGFYGTPLKFNQAALYMPGDLGQTFDYDDGNVYTIVQIDSGATTPAAGQLMYWKDKANMIVTNVVANAINGATTNAWRNEIAGICMLAATAGNYICMLVKGSNISLQCIATPGIGDLAISDLAANVGDVLPITVGTAPTYRTVGVFRSLSVSNKASVDVDIQTLR